MRLSKWGGSLAIRLPAEVVAALGLKDGDEVDIQVDGPRSLRVLQKPTPQELLMRLRKHRGRMPSDFPWNRLDTNDRPP